jgi:hypothetical protein
MTEVFTARPDWPRGSEIEFLSTITNALANESQRRSCWAIGFALDIEWATDHVNLGDYVDNGGLGTRWYN